MGGDEGRQRCLAATQPGQSGPPVDSARTITLKGELTRKHNQPLPTNGRERTKERSRVAPVRPRPVSALNRNACICFRMHDRVSSACARGSAQLHEAVSVEIGKGKGQQAQNSRSVSSAAAATTVPRTGVASKQFR
jgi:hypothetical protein